MILFLGLCGGVVGCFFIICVGKLADAPYWFYTSICGVWGCFWGGLARYMKDKEG